MATRKSKVITRLATVLTAIAMVVPLMSVVGASSANANANRTPTRPPSRTATPSTRAGRPTHRPPTSTPTTPVPCTPVPMACSTSRCSSTTPSTTSTSLGSQQAAPGAATPTPFTSATASTGSAARPSRWRGPDRGRRGLHHQHGEDQRGRRFQQQHVIGEERHRQRQHGHGDVQWHPRLHRVPGVPLEGCDIPAVRLRFRDTGRAGNRQQPDPDLNGADDPGHNQCHAGLLQTNPHWWGIAALGLSFKFKYLCDSVNGSNNVELSALLSNRPRLEQQLPAGHLS